MITVSKNCIQCDNVNNNCICKSCKNKCFFECCHFGFDVLLDSLTRVVIDCKYYKKKEVI